MCTLNLAKKIIKEAYFWLPDEGYVNIYKMEHLYTEKSTVNLVKSTGIGLFLLFSDSFGTKRNSVWS